MSAAQKNDGKQESLNDSWVSVNFQHMSGGSSPHPEPASGVTLSQPLGLHHGHMEKLLIEAQRESRGSSRNTSNASSSRGSPKSPPSPNSEQPDWEGVIQPNQERVDLQSAEWIWDWSSRPEALPPSTWSSSRLKHPVSRSKLSVRNTPVMRSSLFSRENLPALLLSHITAFVAGAAALFLVLKKHFHWGPVPSATVD